jgi:peptide/nickel transport system substrate-binding protein
MFRIVIGLLISFTFLTSCKENTSKVERKVFRLNLSSGVSSLDPAFSKDQATMWMCNQLYNGLLQLDDSLNVIPSIAKDYEVKENGLTYVFHLRNDVFFQNHSLFKDGKGRRVVAEDFVYSFNRIIDETVASTGAWLFNGKVRDVNPFEALDDSTFIIHLKFPFRPMASLLTLQYCSVVPKEIVDHYGKDFRNVAIGTGPFKLVKWQENVALVLSKNENYFEKDSQGKQLPYLDGVKVSFLNDRSVEFLQLLQGHLDMVSGIDKSFRDKAINASGELQSDVAFKVKMLRMPYMNTEYLGFSMGKVKNTAFQNKLVRQAINYAIDREKMITYLRNGIGKPAYYGIIPLGVKGFNEKVKGYSYQPELAKKLLIQAGYPDGKGIESISLSSNPMYQDLTEYIAKSLENIGIKVIVQLSPGSFLREAMSKNEVDFFRASWIGDYPDAENFLALFYGQNSAPPNYTFYKNPAYDLLYQKALSASTDEESKAIYGQMEQIMLDDAPIVPLFYDELIRFTGLRVKYLSSNTMNMLMLKNAQLK